MGAAFRIKDIVGKRFYRFRIGIRILHRNFNLSVVNDFVDIKNVIIKWLFADIPMVRLRAPKMRASFERRSLPDSSAFRAARPVGTPSGGFASMDIRWWSRSAS